VARIATIGVYGFDLEGFLAALGEARIDLVLDVRQRRGVRGREYAWANARRLQAALTEAGIGYEHRKELAPTTELRQLQYREDAKRGEGKRSRSALAPEVARRYREQVLDRVDLDSIFDPTAGAAAALLCLERDPEACHRSLIAARLESERGVRVEHLRP
jgi:uncharacterized protein (DUF488 family)